LKNVEPRIKIAVTFTNFWTLERTLYLSLRGRWTLRRSIHP
jgi:hypothetical protein